MRNFEKKSLKHFFDISRTMIGTLMYHTISESLIPKVSADLEFILVNLIVFLQ